MTGLVDSSGRPLRRLPAPAPKLGDLVAGGPRPRASLSGGSITPYDAADPWNRDFSGWRAWLGSPDTEINPFRDLLVARIRDLVRNDGWAAGAVTRLLDAVVGGHFRLVAKPHWMLLRSRARGFDAEWASQFSEAVEARWQAFSEDLGRWCDISRRLTFSQITRLAFRHKLVDGDALAIAHWEPERIGIGRAQYATAYQLVDPDRLSNPYMVPDQALLRGGVEIDEYGAAVAYHIRRAHQADWFVPERAYTWQRIPRETRWGRAIVVHDFDSERAATHRAPGGVLKPILGRLRMLWQYDATELQSAIVNATLAAYIESPFDHSMMAEALNAPSPDKEFLWYLQQRDEWRSRREHDFLLNGARLPILFPGEKINAIQQTRPGGNFEAFEQAVLRNVAAAVGLSAEQVSGDWSRTNYSAARAALLEAWKGMARMRLDFARGFATPLFANWLEEEFDRGELPLPQGAPDFVEAKNAYCGCRWMGPGRGWVDPLNERRGAVLGLDAGFSTLEQECSEQGLDYREVLAQRAYEFRLMREYGLPRPQWATGEESAKSPETA